MAVEAVSELIIEVQERLAKVGRALLKGGFDEEKIAPRYEAVLDTQAKFTPAYDLDRKQYRVIVEFKTPIMINRAWYSGSVSCYSKWTGLGDRHHWEFTNWMTNCNRGTRITESARAKVIKALTPVLESYAHPDMEREVCKEVALKTLHNRLGSIRCDLQSVEKIAALYEKGNQ